MEMEFLFLGYTLSITIGAAFISLRPNGKTLLVSTLLSHQHLIATISTRLFQAIDEL